MAKYKMESGYQLVARLNSRPTLENIYPNLISNFGPKAKEVIQIFGETSTGKTIIVTEFIAYCILPTEINNINIGGKNAGAIFINTDHHFDIFKLREIMESILEKCINDSNTSLSPSKINNIIESSLRNLIILNCFDSYQLHATIFNLEYIVADNNRIALIVVDSLSAYYWSDSINNNKKSVCAYEKTILRSLQTKVKDYNITIAFTKCILFSNKKEFSEECAIKPTIEKVNYKIFLENVPEKNQFIAHVTFPDNKNVTKYYCIKNLIQWLD